MNLGKLLGAGKSFIGWADGSGYRKNRRVYVPKFNVGKNPFGASEPAAAPATPVAAPAGAAPKAKAAPSWQQVSVTVPPPARKVSWALKLNPFRSPAPEAPAPGRAEQPELSLDLVKPVSNDLADADIEVVPAKSRTVALVELPGLELAPAELPTTNRLAAPEVPEAPVLPLPRRSWEYAGEQLVKPA
jgi:hypothetical protein